MFSSFSMFLVDRILKCFIGKGLILGSYFNLWGENKINFEVDGLLLTVEEKDGRLEI